MPSAAPCSAQSESIAVEVLRLRSSSFFILLVRLSFRCRKVHSILLAVYFVRSVIVGFVCECVSRDAISPKGRKTQVLASNFQVSIICFPITTALCTFSVYAFFHSISFSFRFIFFLLYIKIPWRNSAIKTIERTCDCENIRNLVNM